MTKIYYQKDEISWRMKGDPVLAAQEAERLECRGAIDEEANGCHVCMNSENCWGQYVCMLDEKYPGCVGRGKFRRNEST